MWREQIDIYHDHENERKGSYKSEFHTDMQVLKRVLSRLTNSFDQNYISCGHGYELHSYIHNWQSGVEAFEIIR
jgi:hypothetical protein